MSTILLYHTCGIRGYEYRSTEYICGTTMVHIEQPREKLRCPHCGRVEVSARGSKTRVFRGVPIGSKPLSIVLDVARVYCRKCNVTGQMRVGFADEYRRHTRAFARYALELTEMATIQDVADHLCVGWDLIKELKKSDLARRYRKVRLRGLKHLAIDEICIGRGRRFRTLVLDLDTAAIVFIGQRKGADALKPFWKWLKASRAKIQSAGGSRSLAKFVQRPACWRRHSRRTGHRQDQPRWDDNFRPPGIGLRPVSDILQIPGDGPRNRAHDPAGSTDQDRG